MRIIHFLLNVGDHKTFQKPKPLGNRRLIYLTPQPPPDEQCPWLDHIDVRMTSTQTKCENGTHNDGENSGIEIPPSPRFEHATLRWLLYHVNNQTFSKKVKQLGRGRLIYLTNRSPTQLFKASRVLDKAIL